MKLRAALAAGITLVLAVGVLQFAAPASKVEAAVAGEFNPGMIISDALFYDGSAMSAATVQNFLNSQVSACAAGYTCLKDYRQATPSRAAVDGRCGAYPGGDNDTAAMIIAKVGAACGISQKALIVLLQKEQGLVTATSPSAGKFQIATGYACPDTAACDSTYYGFFNQVYAAASQFKRYATLPSAFNHVAGRVNNVRLHPNAACGSTPVLIQNNATAGLYNYTPYQPNASALANLYGTGDGCASYGNRNFWRYYTDWFGSTTVSSLMRTVSNDTVYLVVGTSKYPITTFALYNAYAPMGGTSYVSQSYLDTLTTKQPASRIIRTPDGAIYFIDSAIKVQFNSCDIVADYGGSCASATGYTDVTAAQAAGYQTGPFATAVYGTVEGARYYMNDGTKREILDDASQAAAGIPGGMIVLTEAGIGHVPYGAPVVRDSVYVTSRETGATSLLANALRYPIAADNAAYYGTAGRRAGTLHSASLDAVPSAPIPFSGAAKDPAGTVHMLAATGRYAVVDPTLAAASSAVPMSWEILSSYQQLGNLTDGALVKTSGNDTVYVLSAGTLRPVAGWDALVRIARTTNPTILSIPASTIAALPRGPYALGPGTLYRTAESEAIYLIDGFSNRIPITSFDYTGAAGITNWTYTSQSMLDAYPVAAAPLTFGVICNDGTKYVSAGGQLHAVASWNAGLFTFPFTQLSVATCATIPVGNPAVDFIRTGDGSIYQLADGKKLPVTAARLPVINYGRGWLQVPDRFAQQYPTGPLA